MPHDNKGNKLDVGDVVNVPCKVKVIQLTEEYCNLTLETVHKMYPSDSPYSISLNAKQVEKK